MKSEEIDQMPAGAELDSLITIEFFGGRKPTPEQIEIIKIISFQFGRWHEGDNFADTAFIEPLPQKNPYTGADFQFLQPRRYSIDIASAWLVIEKLQPDFQISLYVGSYEGTLHHAVDLDRLVIPAVEEIHAHAETMPLAICRVALKAALEMESRDEQA